MTRAHRVRTVIIAASVLAGITACVLLAMRRSEAPALSLVFERYGFGQDFLFQDMAFLRLTNSSNKTYLVPMAGGTNTLEPDPLLSQYGGSYLVICEFSDQANPVRQVPVGAWGRCTLLAPHATVRVRVPLPPKGQKRRVAVFCAEMPQGPRTFWTKGVGLTVVRTLPRSLGRKLLFSQPAVHEVWCERELARAGGGLDPTP